MGNDFTSDQKFMDKYNKEVQDFCKETPLFDPQDIEFPLSTKGVKIVDASGRRVKLAGGNWSGGHLCRQCVDGLQCRPLRQIANDIKYKFRMNCIRLTYSLQLYFDNSVIKQKYLKANPQLIGKTAMQIFDFTVKTLTEVGLMVILNNHTSTSQWCCSNSDGDGLWWSYKYPENMFFQCAVEFARRYKDNPLVIGMDLRNELRKANDLEASWGDNNILTDWRRAAHICAEKVLKIAPHWLIIVAGLNYQLDLTAILQCPLKLSVENKLVYSGHLYSFSWPPSWANFSYDAFKKKLFNSQFCIRGLGYPILMGEFGNNKRDTLWNYLIMYLRQTDVDWTYWPLDGFKCEPNDPEKDETYGIFTNDFKSIRNPQIFEDLVSIGAPKTKPLKLKKISIKQQLQNMKKMNIYGEGEGTNKQLNEIISIGKLSEGTEPNVKKLKKLLSQQSESHFQKMKDRELQDWLIPQTLQQTKSLKEQFYAQKNSQETKSHHSSQIHSSQISVEQILSKVYSISKSQIVDLNTQAKLEKGDNSQQKPKKKPKLKIFQKKIEN